MYNLKYYLWKWYAYKKIGKKSGVYAMQYNRYLKGQFLIWYNLIYSKNFNGSIDDLVGRIW